ncbi:unnamed protein product [Brassica oleracea]
MCTCDHIPRCLCLPPRLRCFLVVMFMDSVKLLVIVRLVVVRTIKLLLQNVFVLPMMMMLSV